MGFFRFRKSFRILPGLRLNLNKGGPSVTVGGRGLSHTVGAKGARTTVGLPGSGLSYTTVHGKRRVQSPPAPPPMPTSQRSKTAGCLYLGGFIVLGIWLLGKVVNVGSSSRQDAPPTAAPVARTDQIRSATPTPPPSVDPRAARTVSPPRASLAPATVPAAKPRPRTAADIQRLQRYVPAEVTLTQPVGFPLIVKGREVGVASVEKGAKAKVQRVIGDSLQLDYQGRRQSVPIVHTDFVDRLLAEAEK